jgi:queuine tRNA-ribosyltransferase
VTVRYELKAKDPGSRARRGVLHTLRGEVQTPAFMPVGTRACVNSLTPIDLRAAGAQMILSNTYHLLLRPGPEALRKFGGVHGFMGWDGPLLTDSGGFQIFSIEPGPRIDEEGARFKSYVDGKLVHLTPEASIAMQEAIGSDVMMVLDHLVPSTSDAATVRDALDRTHRWAVRSLKARRFPEKQALFAIVQGGLDPVLRRESALTLAQHPFDGFAIGGLAVGDTREERDEVIALHAELLPEDKPRYLMGVGMPPDLIDSIGRGVDLFDCVLPTSMASQSTAFTWTGRVRLSRKEQALSDAPLDPTCRCETCTRFPRGYLHHLFQCKEPLATRLLAMHNVHHYLDLMAKARLAIEEGRYPQFAKETLEKIDRHEHGGGERPGFKRSPIKAGTHEVVQTRSGAPSIRDRALGEIMHPVIGARAEAALLYAGQAGLRERLLAEVSDPLVIYDVGLGAGSNAVAALEAALQLSAEGARKADGGPPRQLRVLSFERELGALTLALAPEHAEAFGFTGVLLEAGRALLSGGHFDSPSIRWELVRGELPATLLSAPAQAEVIFWDPWSPASNPQLWSVRAFEALRARCRESATLFTYGAATSTRAALLLAGFAVGMGARTGTTGQTTAAAVRWQALAAPLDLRWLERLGRSSAPLPHDAPVGAIERIGRMEQFEAQRAALAQQQQEQVSHSQQQEQEAQQQQ